MSIHSTDGGATWSSPATVINGGKFIRDVQITGDLAGSGTVYIAVWMKAAVVFPITTLTLCSNPPMAADLEQHLHWHTLPRTGRYRCWLLCLHV